MDHEDFYANSFAPQPGQCFRLVVSSFSGAQGSPVHCPAPVEFRGRYKDVTGLMHDVEACMDHVGDLTDWERVNASIRDIRSARKRPFRSGGGPQAG